MKTKLDYYYIFYETALCNSFSKAAEKLYISQSAISQCIHQLEQDLSVQLFSRSRRGITLTKEGTLLFEKISPAIQSISQGETLLERLKHLESGILTIAAGDSVATHFLLPYLEKYHAMYPDVKIEMANSYTARLLSLVKEGKADLAFVNLPANDEELCIQPCLPIHDIFVCGADFEAKKSYSWKDISGLPLILLEKNSSSRHNLECLFKEKNLSLTPQIELAVHELLLKFASIHLGVSCVVEEFSKEALEKGMVKKLNVIPPLPQRSIGIAYQKNIPLSLAAKKFLELISSIYSGSAT